MIHIKCLSSLFIAGLLLACQPVVRPVEPISSQENPIQDLPGSEKPASTSPETDASDELATDERENSSFQFRLEHDFTQQQKDQSLKKIEILLLDGKAQVLERFSPSAEELKRGFFFGSESLSKGLDYAIDLLLTQEKKGCAVTETYPIKKQTLPAASALPLRLDVPAEVAATQTDCTATEPEKDEMGLTSEDRSAMYYIVRANTTAINFKKEYDFIKTYHPNAEISTQLENIYWFLVFAEVEVKISANKIISYDEATGSAEVEAERKLSIAYTGEEHLQKSLYKLRLDGKLWKIFEIIDLTPAEDYAQPEEPLIEDAE